MRKVGTDLSEAIFADPNCTKKFCNVPGYDVEVMKGQVLDGVAPHMKDYFRVTRHKNQLMWPLY